MMKLKKIMTLIMTVLLTVGLLACANAACVSTPTDLEPVADKNEAAVHPFEFLFDENKSLILDAEGLPIPIIENGYKFTAVYARDDDGNLLLDDEGYPILLEYELEEYIHLDVSIQLIRLDDGPLTYGSHVRLQAYVANAPEGEKMNYVWYSSASDSPLPVTGDHYDFVLDQENVWYSWRVHVSF